MTREEEIESARSIIRSATIMQHNFEYHGLDATKFKKEVRDAELYLANLLLPGELDCYDEPIRSGVR